MASVYIETTIPSYYFETRQTPWILTWREMTRRWWDRHRHRYDLVTSAIVLEELEAAPPIKAKQMLAMIEGIRRLPRAPGVEQVARHYMEHQLMPSSAEPDAFHVAMASIHSIDFLLTWNSKHLANANKVHHLRVLNTRLGLHVPIITTPQMLMPLDAPDAPDEEP